MRRSTTRLVEMLLFKALRRHFGDRPSTPFSRFGHGGDAADEQLLDIKCDTAPLSAFTLDRWTAIVKYKTAFYSFYLPVAMAMVCVRGRVLCTLRGDADDRGAPRRPASRIGASTTPRGRSWS